MPRRITFPPSNPDAPDQVVGKAWKLVLTALFNFGAGPRAETYTLGKAIEAVQRIGAKSRHPQGTIWRLRPEGGAVLFQDNEFDKLQEALEWWRRLKDKTGLPVVSGAEHLELRHLDDLIETVEKIDLNEVVDGQEAKRVEVPPDT